MNILLTAINAKYIHSNLAVYSLSAYAGKYRQHISVSEFTINHSLDFILQEIYRQKPDVLCFSCYIWNISYVEKLVAELSKLRPELPIWVGGPEVSYQCEAFLAEHPQVTGIMRGEGEATFAQLCQHYVEGNLELSQIDGLVYRQDNRVVYTGERQPLSMDELPFCYENLEEFEHRIIYYETSRGCPFRCSYCLSSIEKHLRFRRMELVERELQFFLDNKVPQVKFVDRTFNCNREHAMAIWQYLLEHDNGVTNFHFEISADLMTKEELELISRMRPGLIQLEIGVQTTNPDTVTAIRRTMDLPRLMEVVRQIHGFGNTHQHLDLIAGLPQEGYDSFGRSFDEIFRLHPQQLQLGFLKVLKGSYIYEKQQEYGILCHDTPPYEVLATRWLSYEELSRLKLVEEMLEVYYNSGQFEITMQLLEQDYESPFVLFQKLGDYYDSRGLLWKKHSRMARCEILLDFLEEEKSVGKPLDLDLYREGLTFDLYYRESMKSRPAWALPLELWKDGAKAYKTPKENAHLEPFYYDFTGLLGGQGGKPKRRDTWQFYRFSYGERNPLTGQARVEVAE